MRGGRLDLMPEPHVIDHRARRGRRGPVLDRGREVHDGATRRPSRRSTPCARAIGRDRRRVPDRRRRSLPHAGIADVEGRLIETLRELGRRSRPRRHRASRRAGTAPKPPTSCGSPRRSGTMDRVSADSPVLAGEIALRRRRARRPCVWPTPCCAGRALGIGGHPGRSALERAADVMAARARMDAGAACRRKSPAIEAVYPATARRTP